MLNPIITRLKHRLLAGYYNHLALIITDEWPLPQTLTDSNGLAKVFTCLSPTDVIITAWCYPYQFGLE